MNSKRTAFPLLLLLLLLVIFHAQICKEAEGRDFPSIKQEGYVKVLESLGLVCRCCDGPEGECRSSWDSTCTNLDCQPWKHF
ncbi:hypothetical protein IEQ34_005565 [Dendrobium chrysotoxum]|uniref:Uncharacterized protein n=1 Tax=Dendrobium chrysotoxum TaxID=161865 RepID=A0AAV7H921_DENCH|nr:hypothetical protein IEQ34_005565 [Dendrobium chrysotoxum]